VTKAETQAQDAAQEQGVEETWREVGQQFEALGESLSRAFRAAWESQETQERVRSMQEGLQKMVDSIESAIRDASESQQGQKLRREAEKTAESLRIAGEQTWEQARPQLLSALKKANAELQSFVESMEKQEASGSHSADGKTSAEDQED
jgi:dsDNA-specific endonuclease/ATPase MutS2